MAKTRNKPRRGARARPKGRNPVGPPGNTQSESTTQALDVKALIAPFDVIAKSVAILAMRLAMGRTSDGAKVGPRAQFLRGLGLQAEEIAPLLGSTQRSVAELLGRARRKRRRAK